MKNSRLEGIRFGLFDNCGRQIASGCTNRNGEIDFEGLPMGRYVVKQISRTNDFEANAVCREVVIDCNGRCKIAEFENIQRLGGIRVQLSGKVEHCKNFAHDSRNCDCNGRCREHSNCDKGREQSNFDRGRETDCDNNNTWHNRPNNSQGEFGHGSCDCSKQW